MSDRINALKNAPEVSFIDEKSITDIRDEMVRDFEKYMMQEGQPVNLGRASIYTAILNAAACQVFQAMKYIDRAGKQNLLKYSYGDYLDNLALFKGVKRQPSRSAVTTLRFTLSELRTSPTIIPIGTRASTVRDEYFATTAYAEVPAGEMSIDVPAVCTETGEKGNGIDLNAIHILVDPVPYIEKVRNVEITQGGADVESDDSLADRAYLAPSGFSTAGPEDSYKYHAMAYNSAIGDVVASSDHAAGQVDVVFLMNDGSNPTSSVISGLKAYLNGKDINPMTDLVNVSAPSEQSFDINMTYYIGKNDMSLASAIQSAVNGAVEEYIRWQRHIGRDINPNKLTQLVINAGAKRAEIRSPIFKKLAGSEVAKIGIKSVVYGGLEDD